MYNEAQILPILTYFLLLTDFVNNLHRAHVTEGTFFHIIITLSLLSSSNGVAIYRRLSIANNAEYTIANDRHLEIAISTFK